MGEDEVRQRLEAAARLYEQAAQELERAVGHSRRAAEHFRNHDVPRGTGIRVADPRVSGSATA